MKRRLVALLHALGYLWLVVIAATGFYLLFRLIGRLLDRLFT